MELTFIFRNCAYVGLAYQTYKGLLQAKEMDKKSKGVLNKEVKEEIKKNDE